MTAVSLPLQNVATLPYSAERLARMDRANRVIRIMFIARRRGTPLTAQEAGDIVDAELDQSNLSKPAAKTPIRKPAATPVLAFIVKANQPAANDVDVKVNALADLVEKARHNAAQALIKLLDWASKSGLA